jgi:signal transduction histidine kinase
MLRRFLGDDAFALALQRFNRKHAGERASFADLRETFEGVTEADLGRFEVFHFGGHNLERGIEMTVKTADYLPPLRADKTKIKQILLNLISNAVKFTPEGGEVTVTARIDGDGALILAVADTGIGIAEEDMAKAVSAFGQVASSHTRNHEGMGLGLPLTMALVELHGATLELDSAPGKGTTATVHFPASRVVS